MNESANTKLRIGAAYIRVSSDDQLEYSPESQLKLIRDYAKRDGFLIPDEYVFKDDGISGKSAEKRPAFRLMIAMAKENNAPFESIFVWKFSRFARNQEESIMYKNLLKKKGISVKSISEPSSDSPFSSLIERIIEWMDEYYLINLSGEVKRGMTEKASRGEAMSAAPFGYKIQDKVFIPNEDAETVRYIFQSYIGGKGLRALASELGDRGVRTYRGGLPDNRWIEYILMNPVYAGKIRWCTDGRASSSRYKGDNSNVMIVDGKHEAIIDAQTWELAQDRLADQKKRYGKYQRKEAADWMLKGLCRCSACGSTLIRVNTPSPSMQCHKYARGQCSVSHSLTLAKANNAVIAAIEESIASKTFQIVPKEMPKDEAVRDWDKLIAAERAKLRRANNAYLSGVYDLEDFKSAKQGVDDTICRLEAAKAEREKETQVDPNIFSQKVKSVLDIVKSPSTSETAKNEVLRSVISYIVYIKVEQRVEIFFYV